MERDRRIYPKECFHINEDVTRRRMKAYDRWLNRLHAKCLEISPDYERLPLRDRLDIHRAAERMIGGFTP